MITENSEARSQKLESHPNTQKLLSHRDAENTEPYHTTPKIILLLQIPTPKSQILKYGHRL